MILDTNVVSEPLKPVPNECVIRWLDKCDYSELFITSITMAELLLGVQLLPEGRRKHAFERLLVEFLTTKFGDRVLYFDQLAAREYAARTARARRQADAVGMADALIASVAAAHKLPVATRDEKAFRAMGIPVINPWRP